MHKKADKLLETVNPMLEKMTDDTNDRVPESQLDATMKIVKLAKNLYEIDMIKKKMGLYDNDMGVEYAAKKEEKKTSLFDNPRKDY